MAFLTNDQMKEKRAAIKAAFGKGWKFSVRKQHHTTLCIHLMQYPARYSFPDYVQINHHHIDTQAEELGLGDAEVEVLKKLAQIAFTGHWDKSDIMTDYFHCSWYVNISVGKWDKPAVAA